MRVLVLRHHEEDDAGFVGEAFEAGGGSLETQLYPNEGPLPPLDGYDHLVVLGAKWSVTAGGSGLARELEWLREADRRHLPVLGICFGAQLLSAAFGGGVERAPEPEIGWTTVAPLGEELGVPEGPWLQFHFDRCVLPPRARLVAENAVGPQAFRVGRHLGVQFHPEVDAAQLRRWLDVESREDLAAAGVDADRLLAETAAEEEAARERARRLVGNHLRVAADGALTSSRTETPAGR